MDLGWTTVLPKHVEDRLLKYYTAGYPFNYIRPNVLILRVNSLRTNSSDADELSRICSVLARPPSATCVRVNTVRTLSITNYKSVCLTQKKSNRLYSDHVSTVSRTPAICGLSFASLGPPTRLAALPLYRRGRTYNPPPAAAQARVSRDALIVELRHALQR